MLAYILFFLITIGGTYVGTYFLFKKAGEDAWKGLVPFYRLWVWLDIIDKPKYWMALYFVPVVNLFIIVAMLVEMAKAFGKHSFLQHTAVVLVPFFYLPYLGLQKNTQYIGPGGRGHGVNPPHRSQIREWADALVFAVVAATLIRMFVVEAYTIPTSSMEGSLLTGDFLFVSKFHYGARIPNTPLAFPFAHHTMPVTGTKSYLEWIKLPYHRLPKLQDIKRNDIVVFNFPAGDTLTLQHQSEITYYQLVQSQGYEHVNRNFDVLTRPVDKRENYIKRCVGLPGDELRIQNGQLKINGEVAWEPEDAQYYYMVTLQGSGIKDKTKEKLGISEDFPTEKANVRRMAVSADVAAELEKEPGVSSIQKMIFTQSDGESARRMYPESNNHFVWNEDNFGPVVIPAKGMTIEFTEENYDMYKRPIIAYEGNTLEKRDGKYILNGQEATEYTFKMDYYWMMGDNRHRSQDSRYWGFVPEDHIVGKAWMIWFSLDRTFGGVRFKRLFNGIHSKFAP